ncbi:hypothetical protein [Mycobacterium shigaense]|uniref:hypothetical protein n=1 Tax=Mycobacterium shigaense TaxID=722731 RepID=UPI000E58E678|nr:hypothetical protein [Mycobacterium shigaense]MEA1123769.1 hypothetical protein [Mycobacterium shigaense]
MTRQAKLHEPAVAHADACVNGGGPGGDYYLCQAQGWSHVVPTSGAPDQPVPLTCARFPDKYMCPVDAAPPGLQWTVSGRWFPGMR